MINWKKYLPSGVSVAETPKTRDRVPVECPNCAAQNLIKLNNLITKIRRSGVYACRSCSASQAAKVAKSKYEKTMLERYGETNPQKIEEFKQKAQNTARQRYGSEGSTGKARAMFRAKYGTQNPSQLPGIREKIKKTNQEKYGTPNANRADLLKRNKVENEDQLLSKLVGFLERENVACNNPRTEEYMQASACVLTRLLNRHNRRDLLFKGFYRSQAEQDILVFLKEVLPHAVIRKGDRSVLSGLELDLYLPELKIAIEHHGVYWHSHDVLQDKKYHFRKRQLCEAKGVRLIQFFEDEWRDKTEVCKSIIKTILGVQTTKVHARKTQVKKVPKSLALSFLRENHLMGEFVSGKNLGLFLGNELVQLLVVKKRDGVLELSRLCSKVNVMVVGGFSKLLKAAIGETNAEKVVSFVDLRYADGRSLEKHGFTRTRITLGFKWVHKKRTFNRAYCRANMDERGLSEKEYAEEMGLLKIYDAGQAKWELKIKK